MTQYQRPICFDCRNIVQDLEGVWCPAFPNGIPDRYITGELEHYALDGTEVAPVSFSV